MRGTLHCFGGALGIDRTRDRCQSPLNRGETTPFEKRRRNHVIGRCDLCGVGLKFASRYPGVFLRNAVTDTRDVRGSREDGT